METLWIVSTVLLWLAVVALSLVVLGLTRQIGVLLERVSPAGALMTGKGIAPGEAAPRMELASLDGSPVRVGGKHPEGRCTLLFFLSPTCPVCDTLLPVLRSLEKSERGWLDVLFASDGEDDHLAFVRRKGIDGERYVISRELGMGFRVGQLPFAALVDEQGVVAGAGLTNTREHLESLLEAKQRGVGSLQEHIERRDAKAAADR